MILRQLTPGLILEQHAAERQHGRFEAVAMFVDLSGFSTLSDVLIPFGREGIEVLTEIINRIFDPITTEVYARGGFISTFAGDAFTALFPLGQPDAMPQAILAASGIQKMLAAQQRLHTRLGTFSLAVKIGMDVGRVTWGILGQEGAHTYYFRGPAIAGCALAEALAHPGHIVCSERLWAAIADRAQARPIAQGRRLLSHSFDAPRRAPRLPQLTPERLAPFTPETILNLHVPAEFRNLCSVFISFQEPAEPAELDAFVATIMSLVHIYGGYFNKVTFGDKGSAILALFGAPISYENNIERASEFLLALQDQRCLPRWRAGVTFGTVYAGFVGGDARCEYTAIGDVVNLSARLMMLANWGDILTDERVKSGLALQYHFNFLGRRVVKGKQTSIPIYQLTARRAKEALSEERKPFFGREQELAALRAWSQPLLQANDAQAQHLASFVHVYGEAGVGKTRLLQQFREQLQERRFQWLYCPADDILRQSLNPFVYGLKRFFAQSPDQSSEENRAAFERALSELMRRLPRREPESEAIREELQRTHTVLGALIDIRWKDSLYEQLQPKLRFENTLLALLNFFKALSLLHPLLVEIDGGHLLDGDSRTLLQRMTAELDGWPVGVLVTSRDDVGGRAAALSGTQDGVWEEMRLSPLNVAEVQAMAAEILKGDLEPATARFLFEKTSGNPLFVEQLVQDLRERGVFVVDEDKAGVYTLAATEIADIPNTIDAVLISRLDRLASPVRNVVQTASTLGWEFETPVLALMLSSTSTLPNLMRAAETERIWRPRNEFRYAFVQALLRDVAYHMQMGEHLRKLHRLAAEAYEQLYVRDIAPYYADLAYHFEKGEQFTKAALYLRKAGDQARENYQNEAALAFYGRLLQYAQGDERAQVYDHRGDILHSTGAYDQALDAYANALELLRQEDGSELRLADIDRKIASIHVDKGDYQTALDWLRRSKERLGRDDSAELARVLLLASGIAYRQGNIDQARGQCQSALGIASRIDALSEQAHGYRLLGTIHTGAGDLIAAIQDYRASLELCEELGDLRQQSMASNSLAAVYYYQGEWEKAEQTYLQSLEIAAKIGFVDQQATVSNNLGELYLLQGRFADAEAQFQACLRTWRRTGFLLGVALSYRNLAQIAANRQQWEQAQTNLDESLNALEQLDSQDWVRAEALRLRAEIRLAQGDVQAAWADCRQALAIATKQNIKLVESNVRRVMGQLYRSEGAWHKAEAALRESLALAEELGLRYEQGKAWYELALLYRMQDQPDSARMEDALTQTRVIFSELNADWDLARVDALAVPKN